MSGAFDCNVIDFFVYNEIFDERDGMSERSGKRDERNTDHNSERKRDATPTMPSIPSKMPYNRF